MLLISRRTGESVMLGKEIEIKVTYIEDARVCLAISAPKEVAINRKEIIKKIKSIMDKK